MMTTAESLAAPNAMDTDQFRFLAALFHHNDWILFRPIETWTEVEGGDTQRHSRTLYGDTAHLRGDSYSVGDWDLSYVKSKLAALVELSARERANIFFGVCPRFGSGRRFDRAFQVRTVRSSTVRVIGVD